MSRPTCQACGLPMTEARAYAITLELRDAATDGRWFRSRNDWRICAGCADRQVRDLRRAARTVLARLFAKEGKAT